jgi:2-oxoisovalerate dehydrogenase E1 component alpha subunit
MFEQKLIDAGVLDSHQIALVHEDADAEIEAALDQALAEPQPTAADVEKHTYAPSEMDAVYPEGYTGLP